jgi:hypothetical protein
MTDFSLYNASVPVFAASLANIPDWLDKAASDGKDEAAIMAARLAPDMYPLSAQIQIASDTAKGAVARLAAVTAPAMADTESSFAQLKDRCRATVDFIQGVDPALMDDAAARTIELKFPSGVGYRFPGGQYLTGFALPNFFFHVSMAYAILRNQGVAVGKPHYLAHLGPPIQL